MASATELAQAMGIAMSQAMSQQLAPVLSEITRLVAQKSPRNMVDTRGMGRPPSFSGEEKAWREWRGKLTAYLYATDSTAETSLRWAESQNSPITHAVMVEQCTEDELVDEGKLDTGLLFNKKLYLVLVDTCKGEPYRMVESAGHGNGLEAWRLLMRRYASRTPGTKRALLQNLFSLKPATSSENFESVLLNMEEMVRRYDTMAVSAMSEDIKCAILVACCPRELKEYLDMSTEEFVYQDFRAKANMWIERKRDQQPKNLAQMEQRNTSGTTPMDVSSAQWSYDEWVEWPEQELHGVQDWGGHPGVDAYDSSWSAQPGDRAYDMTWNTPEELHYMYKGKGPKGKGKGKPSPKGGISWPSWSHAYMSHKGKGGFQGKGAKGLPGKGKGDGKGIGTFNGECHWCGAWGHTSKYCRQKDAYMDNIRRGQTSNVEAAPHGQAAASVPARSSLDGLEATGAHRDMGSFELGSLLTKNRFSVLEDAEERGEKTCTALPSMLGGRKTYAQQSCTAVPSTLSTLRGSRTHAQQSRTALPSPCTGSQTHGHQSCTTPPSTLEASYVHAFPYPPPPGNHKKIGVKQWVTCSKPLPPKSEIEISSHEVVKCVDLTIDSGAAEHVVGPHDLPHVRISPSEANATYTMANGSQTTGQGEQQVTALTPAGQQCSFKAQVTGVKRPLMSVSRICDGGNTVFFNAHGGYIQSLGSGEKIHFRRDNNVYRLRVDVPGEDFPRQGQQ